MSALDTIEQALVEAGGDWVQGRKLAEAAGVEMDVVHNFIKSLRLRRPELEVEGRRGLGYRAVGLLPGHLRASARQAALPPEPPAADRMGQHNYRRHLQSLQLLDLLPAQAAELVKQAALDSGESASETALRLILWGFAEHTGRRRGGENPLSFARSLEVAA